MSLYTQTSEAAFWGAASMRDHIVPRTELTLGISRLIPGVRIPQSLGHIYTHDGLRHRRKRIFIKKQISMLDLALASIQGSLASQASDLL